MLTPGSNQAVDALLNCLTGRSDVERTDVAHNSPMDSQTRSEAFLERFRNLTRAGGSPIRALVVDDEPHLVDLMSIGLRMAGWSVRVGSDGPSAVAAAKEFRPDIMVMDVMMPGCDGLEAMRRIKAFHPHVLTIFLTAKDSVDDRVAGLGSGADDYVTKPFSMEELVLRLYSLLSRAGFASADDGNLVAGDLVLNDKTREVRRGTRLIALTSTQFELLRYLMSNERVVLSKADIVAHVWGSDFGGHENVVEMYISYLRKKIDEGGEPPLIHTVRGAGYVLRPAQ